MGGRTLTRVLLILTAIIIIWLVVSTLAPFIAIGAVIYGVHKLNKPKAVDTTSVAIRD